MERYILDKNHLSYWLRQLRNGNRLIAPMREKSGDITFRQVEKIHEIEHDCPASLPPIKEFFFPQSETILRKEGNLVLDTPDAPKTVIFGARSCDVSALGIVDRFFRNRFTDPYYAEKRRNTLIVSIGCNRPDPTCFCLGLGTGPFLQKGFDIQLTDLGDRYFAEASSERAKEIMRKYAHLMKEPEKQDFEDQYEAVHVSETVFEKKINFEGMRNQIISGHIDDEFWESISARCFECGGCTYQCPLCTCFNVMDRTCDSHIERIRMWDSCLFKGFTRMSPAVLPNELRVKRTKRWYHHKIVYYPEQLGTFGCVGCGRCTVACPASIDMATIGTKISHGADKY